MRAVVLFFACMVLAGCTSRADKLQRQFDLMKQNGASSSELCEQAKKIVDASLEDGRANRYRAAKDMAKSQCAGAALDRDAIADIAP